MMLALLTMLGLLLLAATAHYVAKWRQAIHDEERSGTHYLGMPIKTSKQVPQGSAVLLPPNHRQDQ